MLHYFLPSWIKPFNESLRVDLCVYGGTAAGVIAATTAARRGLSAVILHPGHTLGGMTTSGLGLTDYGKKHVIGGAARQFYRDLGKLAGQSEEQWFFLPGAAQKVIDGYVREAGVPVRFFQFLDAVELDGPRIAGIRMLGGLRVEAKMFIDTTYEGDLMAKAGVGHTVGREANSVYGEKINGVQVRDKHQFTASVDPYVVPGDPSSGTLPWVNQQDAAPDGSGDQRVQAYNFRVCMTDDPALRMEWQKPEQYDPVDYELARRWFCLEQDAFNEQLRTHEERPGPIICKFDILSERTPGGFVKTDTNNHGPLSSDFIGANHAWPEADYGRRERIFQAHVNYQKGLYWFMANDPGIPDRYREIYAQFGLPRDEFPDTGHWPHQLYVREARRMLGDYVLTEADTQHRCHADDPVGMGSYTMDSHNCQRFVRDGRVLNEGDVQLPNAGPYAVSYRSIVPKRGECPNLLVPVCLSASHIAYGSVRMEPAFMVLAESAALAASLAIGAGTAVQDVPYDRLRELLEEAGQIVT